jgi:hypothetical protein
MKENLIKLFDRFGINTENNKILSDFLNRINGNNELLKKQYELFLMDLILGLNIIKEKDENSFKRYVKSLNSTKGNENFWGERFEVYMHSKLLKINANIIKNLKRGIDGLEPDLLFNFNETLLGIELTTLKFVKPPQTPEIILSKITDKILEKNSNPYAKENCALIIDITNIIAYGKLLNISLNDLFRNSFVGFDYLEKEIGFGVIILCNSVFKTKSDNSLFHSLIPRIGLCHEKKQMNIDLQHFLEITFNHFEQDDDYEQAFYHKNI